MKKINKRRVGGRYEDRAAAFLEKKGLQVIEKNFRCRTGEIDLIAQKDGFLAFCEVKARLSSGILPREAVTPAKQNRIIRAALTYLSEHPSELQPRFDVIEVTLSPAEGKALSAEHLPGAFVPDQRNGGMDYAAF